MELTSWRRGHLGYGLRCQALSSGVDPETGVVKATIHLGHHPFGVAFGANRIWVTVS